MAVGAGGAVRATGPGRAAGAGPLWLVSAAGVGYGVADEPTAAALGIVPAAVQPAPEAALRLLPSGQPLDLADAGARSMPAQLTRLTESVQCPRRVSLPRRNCSTT